MQLDHGLLRFCGGYFRPLCQGVGLFMYVGFVVRPYSMVLVDCPSHRCVDQIF